MPDRPDQLGAESRHAYYERDGVAIYHGDCREILPTLQKWSADLIVTDPPYGVGYESGYRTGESLGRIANDDAAFALNVPLILEEATYVLRRWRHAYVFGPFVLGPPFTAQVELVWSKTEASGRGNMTIPWGVVHEPIQFAVRASDKGPISAKRGGGAARIRQGSVIECAVPPRGKMRHPTEKPVALLRRLIESSSLVGESVLDPFLGSGSTLVAAVAEGRTGVGIELDERHAETAVQRVDAALDAVREIEGALS